MTGGVFAILDDIAMLLDDAAVMSKVAAKKTAGILGDDLAVNAEKATGFDASRELPVLWAITKGSFLNKIIILPLAFLLSAYASWLIIPILLLGGAYLSFEGVEKIYHLILPSHHNQENVLDNCHNEYQENLEKQKIQSAIRTDFILSIEIVMIALGSVLSEGLLLQIVVVSFIALIATIGVYGLVALLVRMDDMGFFLVHHGRRKNGIPSLLLEKTGMVMIISLPWIIRTLAIVGTIAMLLVGGGMFTHNIAPIHYLLEQIPSLLADLLCGLVIGSTSLLFVEVAGKIRSLLVK